jgi:hypothetical protein
MWHTIGLVILGLACIGVLSADFELLGLRRPFIAKLLAAGCVISVAYTRTWMRLLITLAVVTLLLMIRTDVRRRRERGGL